MNSVFERNGYLVVEDIFNERELIAIEKKLSQAESAGNRSLLNMPWCKSVAQILQQRITTICADIKNKRPTQCTFFQKTKAKNWLVPWHQDRSLPATGLRISNQITRVKNGMRFYQPDSKVLENTIAARLSMDGSHSKNGGLKIISKSHRFGICSRAKIAELSSTSSIKIPRVPRGSAMLMSPLLVHSSSKAETDEPRRVLHFTFV